MGALGVAVALLALVFGVVAASSAGWSDPRVLQSLAVGAGALVAFVWWERRVADPLLDLSLFRSRPLNAALLNGTLIALVMGGAILPLLYFFQNVQGLRPVPALLRIVPLVVAAAACSPFVGGLVARRGPRPVILGGLALIAAGCAGLAFLRPATPYPAVLVALVLIGAGNIAVVTPVTEIVLGSVPSERAGSAAALNNAAMQVGGALGAATLTSVFLDAARSDYAARLASTGLSRREDPRGHARLAPGGAASPRARARRCCPRGWSGCSRTPSARPSPSAWRASSPSRPSSRWRARSWPGSAFARTSRRAPSPLLGQALGELRRAETPGSLSLTRLERFRSG